MGHLEENATSGQIDGLFVSLFAPAEGNLVENYASEGILVFDAVTVVDYFLEEKTFVGSELKVVGTGAAAHVHDNPSSILKVSLDNGSQATFDLADGIMAAAGPNWTVALTFANSNRTASMWTSCGNGSLVIGGANDTVDVTAPRGCSIFFRSHVLDPSPERAITEAVEGGHLAAEIYAGATSDEGADVTTFGDAVVLVAHAHGRLVISLESQTNAPASVVVRFAPPSSEGGLVILIDGQPATYASGIDDALDPTNDNGAVEVNFESDGHSAFVIVSLPSPRTHVIEIQTTVAAGPAPASGGPSLVAVLAAAAVTLAAALFLFRRLD